LEVIGIVKESGMSQEDVYNLSVEDYCYWLAFIKHTTDMQKEEMDKAKRKLSFK